MLLYENVEKVSFTDVEIGDDVYIKPASYLEITAPDGYTYSSGDMKKYCGKRGTVVSKYHGGAGYWVCLDIDKEMHGWSPWMFRLAENNRPEIAISVLFSEEDGINVEH